MLNEYFVIEPSHSRFMQELEGVAIPAMRIGERLIFQGKEYKVKGITHNIDRQRRVYVLEFERDLDLFKEMR